MTAHSPPSVLLPFSTRAGSRRTRPANTVASPRNVRSKDARRVGGGVDVSTGVSLNAVVDLSNAEGGEDESRLARAGRGGEEGEGEDESTPERTRRAGSKVWMQRGCWSRRSSRRWRGRLRGGRGGGKVGAGYGNYRGDGATLGRGSVAGRGWTPGSISCVRRRSSSGGAAEAGAVEGAAEVGAVEASDNGRPKESASTPGVDGWESE
ncbi:hypothetical protein DFH09DRAFT_1090703 [Mycena vulgaris]|nr:hypothetical protein DFH09DRAFT_1090703 [Mycena vulgaris]